MSSLLVWCGEDKAVQSNRHNQGELYLFRYLLFTRSHVCEAQVALKMSPDPPLTSAEQKMSWHFSFEVSLQDWVFLLRRKKKSLCSRRHICLRSTSQQKRNFLVLLYLMRMQNSPSRTQISIETLIHGFGVGFLCFFISSFNTKRPQPCNHFVLKHSTPLTDLLVSSKVEGIWYQGWCYSKEMGSGYNSTRELQKNVNDRSTVTWPLCSLLICLSEIGRKQCSASLVTLVFHQGVLFFS